MNDESTSNADPQVNGENPYVELYLDPNCKHSVKVKASLGEMWAQMVSNFKYINLYGTGIKIIENLQYFGYNQQLVFTGSILRTDDCFVHSVCITTWSLPSNKAASSKTRR